MWYLVVNQESGRYFIKKKTDDIVYFVKEHEDNIEEKTIQELRDNNLSVVGECF